MSSHIKKILLAAGISFIASSASFAATTTTTFQVTATVAAACSVSATDHSFGAYAGVQLDATSTITPTCTLLTPYSISLDTGANASGTQRRMKNTASADYLSYSLFSDALRTIVWGTGGGGTVVNGVGTGLAAPSTVYGRIAAAQNVPTGSYADTITVTLTF